MPRITQWRIMSSDQCRALARVAGNYRGPGADAIEIHIERSPRSLADEAECLGTIYDPRMGPRFEGDACATCGGDARTCVAGHYGIVELGAACVFLDKFFIHLSRGVKRLCRDCGTYRAPGAAEGPCAVSGKSKCALHVSVSNQKNGTVLVDRADVWSAHTLRSKLTKGGAPARYRDAVFDVLLVIPNPHRPALVDTRDPKKRVLRTHRYNDGYIRVIKLVNKYAAASQVQREMYLDAEMHRAVNLMFMCGKPGRAGTTQDAAREEDTTGILTGLSRKRGMLRNNLMGRRVDFCARAVVSGDPTLRVDQFGVPREWVSKLTVPMRVAECNADAARNIVRAGAWSSIFKRYPAPREVAREFVPDARLDAMATELGLGDVVERHLRDGDPVLVNRQPTLHPGSFMCAEARIWDHRTIGMNANVTTPFNGDFDGDEYNLYVCRSETMRAEAVELMAIEHHIVDANGRVQIYPIQNAVLGAYRMSLEDPNAAAVPATEAECKRLVAQTFFEQGGKAAVHLIQRISDLANAWLDTHGASVGLNEFDVLGDDAPRESDGPKTREARRRAREIRLALESAEPGPTERLAFNEAARFLESYAPYDMALRHMRKSGCKGKAANELNGCMALGQQSVCEAAPRMFFGDRILPCGLRSGFVPRGYMQGLKPEQTFVHQMAGRHDVYVKSVGVKVTGDRYRKMSQFLENLIVSPSLAVLDEQGRAVQLVYGEDGMDPKRVRPLDAKHAWATGLPSGPLSDYASDALEPLPRMLLHACGDKARAFFGNEERGPRGAVAVWCRALVEYGFAAGILAAQSIGEPATQETLNKIHAAGSEADADPRRDVMARLFNPGRAGEVVATIVDAAPVVLRSFETVARCPPDTEWTRRYEAHEPFPRAGASGFVVLRIDRQSVSTREALLDVLARLPNRRSMHPSVDAGPAIEVHVALVNGLTTSEVLARLRAAAIDELVPMREGRALLRGAKLADALGWAWVRDAYSDDAKETAACLGIEAARAMLLTEFMTLFRGKVDVRHVMVLVDAMTYTGAVTPVTHDGFRAAGAMSVMGTACFANAVDTFVAAAAAECVETAPRLNVTEAVATGAQVPLGTGAVTLLLDFTRLPRATQLGGDAGEAADGTDPSPLSPGYDPAPTSGALVPFSPASPDAEAAYSPSAAWSLPAAYSPSNPTYEPAAAYSPSDPTYDPGYRPSTPDEAPAYRPSTPDDDPASKRVRWDT